MAYFANGSEGMYYEARYCNRCVHGQDEEKMCPIMELHLLWNYDAVGEKADADKKLALNLLWPRSKGGLSNEDCKFFKILPELVPLPLFDKVAN